MMAEYAAFAFMYSRRLRKKLKEAGAVSEETAKTIEELGLSDREIRTLRRNVWVGKVKKTKDERYYVLEKDAK